MHSSRPWWPRDPVVAARSAAALMLISAAVLILFAAVGPAAGALVDVRASLAVSAVLLTCAGLVDRLPAEGLGRSGAWVAVPMGAVGLIVLLNVVTGDTSAGAQVFFCIPVLWSSSQLRARAAYAICAVAVVGNSVVVLCLEPVGTGIPDAVFVGVVLIAMTGLLTRAADLQEALVAALQHQAGRDPLTGLVTRRVLDDAVAHELAYQGAGEGTALVLVDVDGFKSVNDVYGHPVGDEALMHLATVLSAQVRATDAVVGRLGGDELALLLPGCSVQVAAARAEDLVRAVRASPLPLADGRSLPLSVSIGVAHAQPLSTDLPTLYVAADAALYAAKRGGRDQVAVAPS